MPPILPPLDEEVEEVSEPAVFVAAAADRVVRTMTTVPPPCCVDTCVVTKELPLPLSLDPDPLSAVVVVPVSEVRVRCLDDELVVGVYTLDELVVVGVCPDKRTYMSAM